MFHIESRCSRDSIEVAKTDGKVTLVYRSHCLFNLLIEGIFVEVARLVRGA